MALAKAKAKTNETFIVQASLMIITYNRQNMFIVQATELVLKKRFTALSGLRSHPRLYFRLVSIRIFTHLATLFHLAMLQLLRAQTLAPPTPFPL